MPKFTNVYNNGLRTSERQSRGKTVHKNDNTTYNLHRKFNTSSTLIASERKSFFERVLHNQDRINVLSENAINHVSDFFLNSIDNESHYFKEMLKKRIKRTLSNIWKKKLMPMSADTIGNYAKDRMC